MSAFVRGWARISGMPLCPRSALEVFSDVIYNSQDGVPDGLINVKDLGHWCEMNNEMMSLLNKFEPPGEVIERDSTFLYMKRKKDHYFICAVKYIPDKATQFKRELKNLRQVTSMKAL